MHALRRHQVATFTKEFTREFKIVIAETTVSAFMQNQVASDANEPMHEKLFMKKDIQRTRQWNLPWLNMVKKSQHIQLLDMSRGIRQILPPFKTLR